MGVYTHTGIADPKQQDAFPPESVWSSPGESWEHRGGEMGTQCSDV